jgi:hypothetical protein
VSPGAIAQNQLFCGISATLDVSFQFATVQRCSFALMARCNDLGFQGGEEYSSRIDGRRTRAATKAPQRKRPCRSFALPPIDPTPSLGRGIAMNTAAARRLALGDRVVWVGSRPIGPGIIASINAHEVKVRWDCGTVTRYRRAHLHNLRHAKLSFETGVANQ